MSLELASPVGSDAGTNFVQPYRAGAFLAICLYSPIKQGISATKPPSCKSLLFNVVSVGLAGGCNTPVLPHPIRPAMKRHPLIFTCLPFNILCWVSLTATKWKGAEANGLLSITMFVGSPDIRVLLENESFPTLMIDLHWLSFFRQKGIRKACSNSDDAQWGHWESHGRAVPGFGRR